MVCISRRVPYLDIETAGIGGYMNHKEGCTADNLSYYILKTSCDHPDESVDIEPDGITVESYEYNNDAQRYVTTVEYIPFKFCPMCGCSLSYDEGEEE
jgi:hypothetical protein